MELSKSTQDKRRVGSVLACMAILALGGGCTGTKFWSGNSDSKPSVGDLAPPFSPTNRGGNQDMFNPGGNNAIGTSTTMPVISEIYEKFAKVPATEMVVAWRNWVDYLPDPTQSGRKGPGLAGEMFLFGKGAIPALADGTLTIDLYDDTPRPPGQPTNVPERWSFDKEVLKSLRSTDERFGKCYILFLPWPSYRPDVTQVRITARFDADGRKPLFSEEAKLSISATPPSAASMSFDKFTSNQGAQSLLGQPGFVSGSSSNMGMGSLTSNGGNSTGLSSGWMPLGVIGSQPNGAPVANMAPPVQPDPPLPISRLPVTTVPLSSMQNPGAASAMPGTLPPNAYPSQPATDYRGLTPVPGTQQGLPPLAFTVSPPGR